MPTDENADNEAQQNAGPPYQTAKGVHDILPKDHDYYTFIKKVVRHRCRQAGFRRISTPVFEYTDVFRRSIGDTSDIVSKEMYTFEDRKGRSLTLRPEGTAGVVRSYIQNGMNSWPQPVELYYIENFFRYDRPQKGRYRQFWQFGFEVIGESDPALDAQVIYLSNKILDDLGIAQLFTLQLNSIGSSEDRQNFAQALKDFYFGKERSLCANCKQRLDKNPLRLLDCKEEDCRILAQIAPKMSDHLSEESKEYHEELKEYLGELGIEYHENPSLVRGLDYYTKTVFEFWDKTDGAQNAIGGGGRYDGLIELMGGQPTPACGFAAGIERIIANMKREKIRVPQKDDLHVFVAQLGKEAKKKCLPLIVDLRDNGIRTMGALGKGAIKTQLRLADKFKVPYTIIIGITEVRENAAIVRDMRVGTQKTVPFDKVVDEIIKRIGEENRDMYSPGEAIY
ncbi:histidine--tRNA ligase [Patescibacteria group bacterium]|nr:histidine--tRNA ligase [Patescibacteria group bacterium]MBU1703704.1 histidine--tRNA ligase [Patescibacteria group bacterium]MBU1954261.1 histidine--tRNA ligase [Patescibacteria group bacterium]